MELASTLIGLHAKQTRASRCGRLLLGPRRHRREPGARRRACLRCNGPSRCAQSCCRRSGPTASGLPTRRGTWPGWPWPAGGRAGQGRAGVGRGSGRPMTVGKRPRQQGGGGGGELSARRGVPPWTWSPARGGQWARRQRRAFPVGREGAVPAGAAPHLVALLPQPLGRVNELQDLLGAVPHVDACTPRGGGRHGGRAPWRNARAQREGSREHGRADFPARPRSMPLL